jgi:3',5'-cyclic AMP phosphodiesterase CpdA
MLTLLQISDFHCGPAFLPRVAEALVRQIPSLASDAIIISGDFTQRAKRHQYQQARELLDQLPGLPTVVVPGNHDVPLYRIFERMLWPHALYREYISDVLDNVTRIDGAVIVSLDSTSPYGGVTNGRITQEQLDFCEQSFRETPAGAARIVVAHHHFAPAPDYERSHTMRGAKRAMNRFLELGVDMILGGHLHRAYIGNSLDVYPGGARRHGIIIVQCGTTTSRRGRARERERNSFNLINIWENMLRITHYMYFDDRDEFAPLSRHIFPRSGGTLTEDELQPG